MEDYLREATDGAWTWSVFRPSFLIGFAPRAPQNFGTGLAVYATVLKEMGRPLVFPGGHRTYHCLWEATCTRHLSAMMHWSATDAAGANQAFNCVNGDVFTWSELWPKIAGYFGMRWEAPRRPQSVQRLLAGKEALWDDVIRRHGLAPYNLTDLVNPRFMDQSMVLDWDVVFSMAKARACGFTPTRDNLAMFTDLFDHLRVLRVIA